MKRHFTIFLNIGLFLTLLLAGFNGSKGQQTHINADVDSNNILIGSPFHYHIKVSHSKEKRVKWSMPEDTLGAFEILEKGKVDSKQSQKSIIKQQTLKITSFKPGIQVIPAIEIPYKKKGDTSIHRFQTDTIQVKVKTMAVDTSKSIKPVKAIYDIPLTFSEIWPYLTIGLVIILLVFLGIWFYKRWKRKPAPSPKPKPRKPPHEIAVEKLENLKSQQLWQQGYIKEYHDQLTDIVREYLEYVFQIHALELTTGEIMNQLQEKPLSQYQRDQLQKIFETADLAKFAKANPSPEENNSAMDIAFDFIRETKGPEPDEDAIADKA